MPGYAHLWAKAWPILISNLTTPLTGLVDAAVIGRSPEAAPLAAVGLSAAFFNALFLAFGFLRMGTTSVTARAEGAGDADGVITSGVQSLMIAVAIGAVLIAAQALIAGVAFPFFGAQARVEALARTYFEIRILAAPATLANYVILGWLVGLGHSRLALAHQVVLNIINMALSVLFAGVMGLGVAGVALGTLGAEVVAVLIGAVLVAAPARRRFAGGWGKLARLVTKARSLGALLSLNIDIFIRTLALLAAFVWFARESAGLGATIQAANQLLLLFVSLAAAALDGIAFAAEGAVGRAVGARHPKAFRAAMWRSSQLAFALSLGIAGLFAVSGVPALQALTQAPDVQATAIQLLPFAVAAPVMAVAAYQLDGIYLGVGSSRILRNAMLGALAVFFAVWWFTQDLNAVGLWLALHALFLARAGFLGLGLPVMVARVR